MSRSKSQPPASGSVRHLHLIFGDQLDEAAHMESGFDPTADVFVMAEVCEEATAVPCHKRRLAFFFAAMRHLRQRLEERNCRVDYHALTRDPSADVVRSLPEALQAAVERYRPKAVRALEPGDWRVREEMTARARTLGVPLTILPDPHFLCTIEEFRAHAKGRKTLIMEAFYRQMRRKHRVLLDDDGQPADGAWNFDASNRAAFGRQGPPHIPAPRQFPSDAITSEVIDMVRTRFASHPGSLDEFNLPVTPADARLALNDFVTHRLPGFGLHEDAMWTDEPFLYHSRLSMLLNVKLLDPRECLDAAVAEWEQGRAPINSVEGFVRQILGWREFIRGVYWLHMPQYAELNHFDHRQKLPAFYWTGDTDMQCLRQSLGHVVAHGYAHHIHRLMVMGLFAQLLGVHPYAFHQWHMAMYLDAIDWVSLPNTLGMSQYGDGGIVGTKPYCASGNYIQKMSPFCKNCRYRPDRATGAQACPFTTLYWDFLARHAEKLDGNPRMGFQMSNLRRRLEGAPDEMAEIRRQADRLRVTLARED